MAPAILKYFSTLLCALLMSNAPALGHDGTGPRGHVALDWTPPHISRVFSAGYGETFGLDLHPRRGFPQRRQIAGRTCFTGSFFAFDVDDEFAFDIDETVTLSVLLHRSADHRFILAYDRNAQAEFNTEIEARRLDGHWYEAEFQLKRARFANRGQGGSDFVVAALGADSLAVDLGRSHMITICDIDLQRSNLTKRVAEWGEIEIRVNDENGSPAPSRMGLYDASRRMPLPSEDAIRFQHYADFKRQHFLRITWDSKDPWPSANRNIFYIDGRYRAKVPAGRYRLVISRGPEYRMIDRFIDVTGHHLNKEEITLARWQNMPAEGWYSGDGHIHLGRTRESNHDIATFLQAEDLHVSNLLEMGNPGARHFRQYAFGAEGLFVQGKHVLVSGVEDPRTAHRGHTIGLNITHPVRGRAPYFHYHKVLEAYGAQGGLRGYAHVGSGWFNSERGLALDMPFGLVDFVEILQFGSLHTALWYDFLNLGYRVVPTAGSDYPYIDQPGSVRSYVQIDDAFSPQAWFDGLKEGRTFVTNGPFLTFTVNDSPMGSVVKTQSGDAVTIHADVRLNPDFDQLDRLELVVRGEVVNVMKAKKGDTKITLRHRLEVSDGLWIAVRALGRTRALAHSAPIYVHTSTGSHMDITRAPDIVRKLEVHLRDLKTRDIEPVKELEYWEVEKGLEALWADQKPALAQRVDEAIKRYRELIPR